MSQPSKAEVGWADNGPERLPSSIQGAPSRGSDPYGSSDFAKAPSLETADTAGIVGQPSVGSGYGMPSMNAGVSVTNEGTSLNTTASTENRSAKFKNPNVKQTFPSKGGPDTQFDDHN
jgi:hypothetical protein